MTTVRRRARSGGRSDACSILWQAAEAIPGPGVTAGGLAYEQKFDGHRAILFTPTDPGGRVLLQTRRGSLVQDRFPDLVAAAGEQLPGGLVLDGELLVWDPEAGRLSFEALQRRAAARARSASILTARTPAYFVAFDVLQADGVELLALPYRERRRRLEVLFAARGLAAPWTLCPMTTDPVKAREYIGWIAQNAGPHTALAGGGTVSAAAAITIGLLYPRPPVLPEVRPRPLGTHARS
ncbi:hypothetical protein OG906_34265 [Streptomyces sp. NBC_01426]|uniref:ATP-dependent DNA ligase n=1 Tax=Streptomyces sp. NBC_01426 TaxID=2975866 RepID=UPI002E31558B|nr:hypothetical protein [Streptomyces sp. NBC_01426]